MRYSNIPLAHTVVTLCKLHGVKQVVISPGSRNAPLILAFTADSFFECLSVVDERSAGFFALGLSQQSGIPTALVCSSGSALLNYYPAVAEAFYSRIPLLVLSADRPPYMVDIGDGQTIRQAGVFGNHIGYEANLEFDLTHASAKVAQFAGLEYADTASYPERQARIQQRNASQIHQALQTALSERLPVHLNVPLEEPLYGTQDVPPVTGLAGISSPETEPLTAGPFPDALWQKASKKLVLIGSMSPGEIPESLLEYLAADPSVVVFTETTSNVHHASFFPSIDSIIAPIERSADPHKEFKKLQPDLLLTLGGMVVSKKIKQFLRTYRPELHWHIDPHQAYDTYFCLNRHFKCTPSAFIQAVYSASHSALSSDYRDYWSGIRDRITALRDNYVLRLPFSDFKAFERIFSSIPQGAQLQLANSATVRYAQLFPLPASNPVYCNRGTSGIEGSTSTAVGAAWNYAGQTVFVTGDLSFLYDANGLWNRAVKSNFRVIVVHNSGGGIFRILPGFSENQTFETYFETVHNHDLGPICQHHGFRYFRAGNDEELVAVLEDFYDSSDRPAVLEVRTPREVNNKILLGYFESLTWQ